MARPTRHGRPRRWPPPLFFRLVAVGLRPIDRHPTPACPAQRAARSGPAAWSEGSCTMRATRCTPGPAIASGAWGRREVGAVGSIAYSVAGRQMRVPASSSLVRERSLQVAGPYREVKSAVAVFESEWQDVFSIHRRCRPAREGKDYACVFTLVCDVNIARC